MKLLSRRPVLCYVTDRHQLAVTEVERRQQLLATVRAAALGGVDLIQVRERDLDAGSLLAVVVECLKAVHETDTALVVNDRIDVALAARAAGVHLRADSVAPERARALVGPAMLIGRSVHSVAEAQLVAEAGGVDYLVFGTVFPSASKGPRHEALGIDRLLQVVQAVTLPVLAIGGVGLEQVADIGATGAAGVAGIGYFQTGTQQSWRLGWPPYASRLTRHDRAPYHETILSLLMGADAQPVLTDGWRARAGQHRAMKFGARLRAAREARGLTLREISARTRISLAHFEALERDQISKLPGGIFSRAFVRAYAAEVGLDPEAAVQEFLEAFSDDGLTAGRAQIELEDNQAIESQRRAAQTVVKLLFVSIPLVMTLMYFTLAGDEPVSSPAPSTASATRDLKPPPDAPPLPVQSAVGAAVRDEAIDARMENLEVVLRSSRECWVSATADGSVLFAVTMIGGEERTIRAERNLALTIGDAGAMTLFINNERTAPIGGDGQVVTIRVTPENYRRLLNGR